MAYRFEWDEVNTAKVETHGLTTDDVESVFFADDLFALPGKKARTMVCGTVDGRFICVVFRLSAEFAIRVTTAYPTSARRIKR